MDESEIPDDGEWHHIAHHRSGSEEVITLDDEIIEDTPIVAAETEKEQKGGSE